MKTITYHPRNVRLAFLETAIKDCGEECITWPFSTAGQGYGVVRLDNRQTYAHRVACAMLHGHAPAGKLHAAHLCGNRLCVNPAHLRWATAAENAQDKKRHGTNNDGERHGMSRLTNEQAKEIRKACDAGATQIAMARKFGVSPMVVSRLVRGLSYEAVA